MFRYRMLTLGTLLLLLLLTTSVHAAELIKGCLVNRQTGNIFNLETGTLSVMPQRIRDHLRDWDEINDPSTSPDQTYAAYEDDDNETGKAKIYVKQLTIAEPLLGKAIYEFDITERQNIQQTEFAWSPDGKWIVFLYTTSDNQAHLGISDIDGKSQKVISIALQAEETLHLDGLNSMFIATSKQSAQSTEITYYALPTLKAVWSMSNENRCLICGLWSFDDQKVAYLFSFTENDIESSSLLILSIATKSQLEFKLTGVYEISDISWSPDSRYIALTDHHRNLTVFDTKQGIAVKNIVGGLEQFGGGDAPQTPYFHWNKISNAVLFAHYGKPDTGQDLRIASYRIDEKQYVPLLSTNWFFEPYYNNAVSYAWVEWESNNAHVSGILDLQTGKTIKLYDYSGRGATPWWINDDLIWIKWSDNNAAHVKVARTDGTTVYEIELPLEHFVSPCNFCVGGSLEYVHQDTISPDQKTILVYTSQQPDSGLETLDATNLWVVDIATGHYQLLADNLNAPNVMLSPDSQTIAISDRRELKLIDPSGQTLVTDQSPVLAMVWSPDGSMFSYSSDISLTVRRRDGTLSKEYDDIYSDLEGIVGHSYAEIDALKWLSCQ